VNNVNKMVMDGDEIYPFPHQTQGISIYPQMSLGEIIKKLKYIFIESDSPVYTPLIVLINFYI